MICRYNVNIADMSTEQKTKSGLYASGVKNDYLLEKEGEEK